MSKGDYIDVTYRTGAGTEVKRVQARGAGASVEVTMPQRPSDLFVTVEERNKTGEAIRTVRFAKGEVVAVDEGNAPVLAAKK